MMDDLTQLKVDVDGHVALLTMDNPPVNALSRVLNDELTLALDRISEIDDIRVVVLTGAGKVFCAGADLKGRAQNIRAAGDFSAHSRRTRECFHAIRECAKPVIAAINGPALGSGLAMVASADVLIASEKAALGLPEVDVGLLGGCRHAMRLFGHSRTRRMMLTGYPCPGRRVVPARRRRSMHNPGRVDAGRARDGEAHRVEEPGVYAHGQAHAQHHRGHEPARRLPLRTGHDASDLENGRRERSAACVRGEAGAGFQGALASCGSGASSAGPYRRRHTCCISHASGSQAGHALD